MLLTASSGARLTECNRLRRKRDKECNRRVGNCGKNIYVILFLPLLRQSRRSGGSEKSRVAVDRFAADPDPRAPGKKPSADIER